MGLNLSRIPSKVDHLLFFLESWIKKQFLGPSDDYWQTYGQYFFPWTSTTNIQKCSLSTKGIQG